MMKRKEAIHQDLQALINHVTHLNPRDENFKLCIDFAESNIKYHRFLSPDSHKIERAVEGLCDKFRVHSQLSKACDLKDLTDHFLDQTGLESREHGKTNTHYALLSLLVELAENPTNNTFHRLPQVEKIEEIDDFDWRGYLLDPQDLNFISYGSSDSEGEDLSESSEDEIKERRVAWAEEILNESEDEDVERSDPEICEDRLLSMSDKLSVCTKTPLVSGDFQLLEQSLVVEYWKGKGREEDEMGSHSVSNLAKDWNCYQQRINEFYVPTATVFVTEAQLIRETLWMLSGIKDLFIFTHEDRVFSVNPDIYVSHLTHESLSSFLQPLMTQASQVSTLQSFVKDTVSARLDPTPQTYQAFADRLWLFLTDFKHAVKDEEEALKTQENPMTLAKMTSDLRPWFLKLEILYNIFLQGIQSAEDLAGINNALRSSLLLNTLYQALHQTDPVDSVDSGSKSELVVSLLVHTSRPLLDMVSGWITNGQFTDPMKEFVVERNKDIKSLDETFWEKAFVSHIEYCPETSLVLQGHIGGLTPDKKWKSQPSEISDGRGKSSIDSRDLEHLLECAPVFLHSLLKDALVIGKSMELLENIGRLGEVLPGHQDNYRRPPSLYEILLQDLNTTFSRSRDVSLEERKDKIIVEKQAVAKDFVVQDILNARGTKDTLLNINSATIFPSKSLTGHQSKECKDELRLSAMMASDVLRHCENCLQSYVRSRYDIVCPRLVEILKSKYRLMESIQAMQRFYLMSDGDIMSDFCSPIFRKIENREYWQDTSILDLYLHEALGHRYPEEADRLRVDIVPLSQARGPINVTDCIRLKYHVPWPVDVVISGKCEDAYNSIFSFLLQIKRSKSSLEQLRFEELSRERPTTRHSEHAHQELGVPILTDQMDRHTRVQRYQLLRFRLLYFVNSVHNYITTRILHSSGLEFAHRFEAATDLDQIISIHGAYVDIIYERCLLHARLSTLKDTVVQILNLSLTVSSGWHQGVDFIKGTFIQEMESKLTRCIDFLSSFLLNVIKRGSFPHLESLAVSLTSLQQQPPANR